MVAKLSTPAAPGRRSGRHPLKPFLALLLALAALPCTAGTRGEVYCRTIAEAARTAVVARQREVPLATLLLYVGAGSDEVSADLRTVAATVYAPEMQAADPIAASDGAYLWCLHHHEGEAWMALPAPTH